jgi:hypothetical protein
VQRLNLNDGANQIGMVQHLLGGQAQDTFNQFMLEAKKDVQLGLKKVAATIFVESATTNQKQYMRHKLKKPNRLTARETATRLLQLNAWLFTSLQTGLWCTGPMLAGVVG